MHGPPQNHIRNHPKPPETNHPLTCRDLWAPPQWAFNFPETWQNASLGKTLVWQDASTFLFVFGPTGSPLSFGLFNELLSLAKHFVIYLIKLFSLFSAPLETKVSASCF